MCWLKVPGDYPEMLYSIVNPKTYEDIQPIRSWYFPASIHNPKKEAGLHERFFAGWRRLFTDTSKQMCTKLTACKAYPSRGIWGHALPRKLLKNRCPHIEPGGFWQLSANSGGEGSQHPPLYETLITLQFHTSQTAFPTSTQISFVLATDAVGPLYNRHMGTWHIVLYTEVFFRGHPPVSIFQLSKAL